MNESLADNIYDQIHSVGDWCTREKVSVLVEYITRSNPTVSVEIGVFLGQSAFTIAMCLRAVGHGTLFAVDPWSMDAALEGSNDPKNDAWWGAQDMEQIYRSFLSWRDSLGLADTVEVLRMKSEQAAASFQQPVDFLHIDGNHSEEISTQDVGLWLPKTSPGSYIVLDDTNWPTTTRAQSLILDFATEVADHGGFKVYQRHDE